MLERGLHPDTKALLATWRRLNRSSGDKVTGTGEVAPPGFQSQPAIIDRLFMLERMGPSVLFRMAGEQVRAMFGRDLAAAPFTMLFAADYRLLIAAMVESSADCGQPGLVRARLERSDYRALELEILLAPIRDVPGRRLMGLVQPLNALPPLRMPVPSPPLQVLALYPPDPVRWDRNAARPNLRLVDGRAEAEA